MVGSVAAAPLEFRMNVPFGRMKHRPPHAEPPPVLRCPPLSLTFSLVQPPEVPLEATSSVKLPLVSRRTPSGSKTLSKASLTYTRQLLPAATCDGVHAEPDAAGTMTGMPVTEESLVSSPSLSNHSSAPSVMSLSGSA